MICNGLGGLGAAEPPQKTTAKALSQNPKSIINHHVLNDFANATLTASLQIKRRTYYRKSFKTLDNI
jgi:hypothetical protein